MAQDEPPTASASFAKMEELAITAVLNQTAAFAKAAASR